MLQLVCNAVTIKELPGFVVRDGLSAAEEVVEAAFGVPVVLVDAGTPCIAVPVQESTGMCLVVLGGYCKVLVYAQKGEFERTT